MTTSKSLSRRDRRQDWALDGRAPSEPRARQGRRSWWPSPRRGFALWIAASLLVSCAPELPEPVEPPSVEHGFALGDPWRVALTKAYVVGSSVPLRLTEWMRPTEGVFVLARLCSAEVDVCVEHTGFEVVSSDPTVVRIDRTESGVVLRAIAPGVSRLDALHEGSPVTSVVVEVAQPERLELWMRGPGVLLPSHAAERVTRFVGGVLELQVRSYVGDRRFFGSSVARWETSLPYDMPTFSGNVVRIVDSEVGIERVRVVLEDLSAELEVRSVDTVDELFVVEVGDVDFDTGEPVWEPVLVATTKDGAPVRGLLPFRWSVDGADVEAGPWLQCRLERGAPSVVAVRLGGLETSVGLAGTCVEVRSWP